MKNTMKRFLLVSLIVLSTSVLWVSAAYMQSEATEIEGNLYTNNTLGFSFQFPQGWVVDEASGDSSTMGGDVVVLKATFGDSTLSAFSVDLPKGLPLDKLAGSAEQWLNEHQSHLPGMNLEVRSDVEQVAYGNIRFYKLKFRTKGRRNRVHHTTVVTVTPGKLIGFEAIAKREKDADQALNSLQSIKLFDAEFTAWQAHVGIGDPEGIVKSGAVFLERFPAGNITPYVHKRMAFSYQALNDYDNLVIHGERTIELLPEDLDTRSMLALALAERGDNNRAIDLAQQGLALVDSMEKPADVPLNQWLVRKARATSDANYAQGLAYLKKSSAGGGEIMLKRAIEYLGEAVESDPESDKAYFRLGYAYTRLNDAEQAIVSYTQAVAADGVAKDIARDQLEGIMDFLKRDVSTIDALVQEQRVIIEQKIEAIKTRNQQQVEAEEARIQLEMEQQEMELQQQAM
ncbi:MAG: tetratricopeptide repeat protein [Acidobacteriota bacterium]|nr:tetratricopeptide repeat protein [Acidobacteriota bacterium]